MENRTGLEARRSRRSRANLRWRCECYKIRLRTKLGLHWRPILQLASLILITGWLQVFHPKAKFEFMYNYRHTIHTFRKGSSIIKPGSCELCELVSATFERTQKTSLDLKTSFAGWTKLLGKFAIPVPVFVLHLEDLQLLPLAEDAHHLGKRPANHARELRYDGLDTDYVKHWLRTCEAKHPSCNHKLSAKTNGIDENDCPLIEFDVPRQGMPRRLINVRTMSIENAPFNSQSDLRYLALSYVWGDVERTDLSQWSAQEHTTPGFLNIDSDMKLHRVVRDAIILTQRLDETYLWVDSLCINQNDSGAKEREIKNMNHIYKGATMTIVAIGSDNANDSLPGISDNPPNRDRSEFVDIEGIRMLCYKGTDIVLNQKRLVNLVRKMDHPKITRHDWQKRAWTLQESIFSRRKLLLTEYEAYFYCSSSIKFESRAESPEDDSDFHHFESAGFNYFRRMRFAPITIKIANKILYCLRWLWVSDGDIDGWWNNWYTSIDQYSRRSTTRLDDRYPAYRGIESEQQELRDISFVLGMPVQQLPQALLWSHDLQSQSLDNTAIVQRIEQYPSWSWTGWDGHVRAIATDPGHISSSLQIINISYGMHSARIGYTSSGETEHNRNLGHKELLDLQTLLKHYETSQTDQNIIQSTESSKLSISFEANMIQVTTSDLQANSHEFRDHKSKCEGFVHLIPSSASIQTITCIEIGTRTSFYHPIYTSNSANPLFRKDVSRIMKPQVHVPIFIFVVVVFHWLMVTRRLEWILVPLSYVLGPFVYLIRWFILSVPLVLSYLFVLRLLERDRIVYLLVVREVGDGVFERIGMGEIGLWAFRRRRPRRRTFKII